MIPVISREYSICTEAQHQCDLCRGKRGKVTPMNRFVRTMSETSRNERYLLDPSWSLWLSGVSRRITARRDRYLSRNGAIRLNFSKRLNRLLARRFRFPKNCKSLCREKNKVSLCRSASTLSSTFCSISNKGSVT